MSTIYDEYTILAQINQGGNGTVFRVSNSNGQLFALKAIDRNNTSRDKLKRFRNELAFCENDNHKNIIKIIDHGTYEKDDINVIFYVMPFCPMTNPQTVNTIAFHIKEWLTSATAIFNRNQRQDLERKRMEEERKIEVEIQHRKAEEEIRKALNLTF